MQELPVGRVTFLMTDVEGSTRLWEQEPDAMARALADHDRILGETVDAHGGNLIKSRGEGDATFSVFADPGAAAAASIAAQRALGAHRWPEGCAIRVRIALHTGEVELRDGDYYGQTVNRAARIRAVAHGEQVVLSEAVASALRDAIGALTDLGTHRLKDLQRPERLFQLSGPGLPASFPALRSLDALPNNLPSDLSAFVGRADDVAEVRAAIEAHRLVTLTGPGGIGKTRLALQAVADSLDAYPDGAWLVELAALRDPDLVPQAVAAGLELREEPGRTLIETIEFFLRDRTLVIVLDNCEHLVGACAKIADRLLRACRSLRILATSREPLAIDGEAVRPVGSLPLPEETSLERIAGAEAVRLFVERAALASAAFRLEEGNAAAVARICCRLDGIPLAIELAASRARVLSPADIAERLDDRFSLLKGGSRAALPHQQTLRATMDWSYDLLSEPERTLLRRLAVFAGGFLFEAAEAVCIRDDLDAFDLVDLLQGLVDRSLVVAEDHGGRMRYHLLETVRAYAADRLGESQEERKFRDAHLDWVNAFVDGVGPDLLGPEMRRALDLLEEEHDNIRRALDHAEAARPEAAMRIATGVCLFWELRGYVAEGRGRLDRALAVGVDAAPDYRAGALRKAGHLADVQGEYPAARALIGSSLVLQRQLGETAGIAACLRDLAHVALSESGFDEARAHAEESLTLYRASGDTRGTVNCMNTLARIARKQGDFKEARALFKECLAIWREISDPRGVASALNNLGDLSHAEAEYATARHQYEESLAIRRDIGDRPGVAVALGNLGLVAYSEGDHEAAGALFEESLAMRRETGDRQGICEALSHLGLVAAAKGDYKDARRRHEESLAISREIGHPWNVAASLNHLGLVARAEGDPSTARAYQCESLTALWRLGAKDAVTQVLQSLADIDCDQGMFELGARILGASVAAREALGVGLDVEDLREYEHVVAAARAALGGRAFEEAFEEGRKISLDEAIDLALRHE